MASSEPKVGLEFAMPKTPPTSRSAKKARDGRRSRQRLRSAFSTRSSSRQCDEVRATVPRGVNTSDVPVPALKRARGRGGGKVKESPNAQLLLSTVSSHLSGITKPKEGLKVTIPAEGNATNSEAVTAFLPTVRHLSKLDSIASELWELSQPTSVEPNFTVEIPQETLPDDSDVDLRMGKVKDPSPWCEPLRFTYKARSVLENHQKFAAEVLRQEPKVWGPSTGGEQPQPVLPGMLP